MFHACACGLVGVNNFITSFARVRNPSFSGLGGVARLKLEGIDGKAPSGAEPAACERPVVVCVGEGGTGVCIERVSVCTFKTPPCVPAPSPHVSYMWAWCRYTRGRFERTHLGFSACHGTPPRPQPPQPQPQRHRTTNQPAAQCAPTRENSPGPGTVRIDSLKALSSFSVWWSMSVFSW